MKRLINYANWLAESVNSVWAAYRTLSTDQQENDCLNSIGLL